MTTPSFRDVEQLSVYLDGGLSQEEAVRLESRLGNDPQLASVFEALRQSRAVLRHLPQRRAPRNFTLTPKMVRQKPPLPRAYPFFRFSTALAALLLLFTFAVNAIGPIPLGAMATAPSYGVGDSTNGPVEEPALALEAPAATEAPAQPEVPPGPSFVLPLPAQTASAAESARAFEATPEAQPKQGVSEQAQAESEAPTVEPGRTPAQPSPNPIPLSWQIVLGILALANASIVFLMRKYAASQWRK
ncbi:MAG: hypothetical protein Fur0043_28540 [Anaerolineales bacterium]